MKVMSEGFEMESDGRKDFTIDDLAILKEDLLNLEKAVDAIKVVNAQEGATFAGSYIFDLLDEANITAGNFLAKTALLDSLVAFLTNVSHKNSFFRRGAGLQKLQDMLNLTFSGSTEEYKRNVSRWFKVHVGIEQQKPKQSSTMRYGWIQRSKAAVLMNKSAKIVTFRCFSFNFGLQQLLSRNVRSIILNSGNLDSLEPLIIKISLKNLIAPQFLSIQFENSNKK